MRCWTWQFLSRLPTSFPQRPLLLVTCALLNNRILPYFSSHWTQHTTQVSGNAEDEDGIWNQEIAVQPTDVCTSVIICCNGRLDDHHVPNGWPNFRNILLGGASPPICHALCVPVRTHRAVSFSSSPSFSVFFLFLSHGSFTPGSRLEATGRPFFVRW